MPVPLLVLLVMLGLALALIVSATVRFRRDRSLLREGTRVPGEVVDLLVHRSKSSASYTPVVRFRTADGALMTSSPGRWHQTFFTAPDSLVTVVYDPSRPARILVVPSGGTGTESMVVPLAVLLMVGVAVTASGVYVFQAL
ncbi:DUF3592 domain-containing protein [Micromonospora sp. NPDC007271]|uniref:DUF3592 domain-containing protein n=1 Tax=Micromonospora sp. NPDC007271 TaxID=3154587 RepID=UPI0033E15382